MELFRRYCNCEVCEKSVLKAEAYKIEFADARRLRALLVSGIDPRLEEWELRAAGVCLGIKSSEEIKEKIWVCREHLSELLKLLVEHGGLKGLETKGKKQK